MDFSEFYEHEITIYKVSSTSEDSAGGTSNNYAVRQSAVPCSILSPTDSAQERFDREQLIGNYTFACAYTSGAPGDKIVVTAGPTLVGVSFHVVGIKTQPGLELLDIDDRAEYTAERVRR